MYKLFKFILLGCILFSCGAFASTEPITYYSAVVDAGSSGSRIYLFSHQHNDNNIPNIKLIASKKIAPGISDFADNEKELAYYVAKLLKFAQQKVPSGAKVDFSLLATAGMRLVPPDQQQKIYKAIKNAVQDQTNFNILQIKTITGTWEAIYGWLAANYLNNSLSSGKTVGILDMGGASAEITFAVTKDKDIDGTIKVPLGPQTFILYAVSNLGLGQNQMRDQYMNNKYCFPKGYPLPSGLSGSGNYKKCCKYTNKLIKKVQKVSKIKSLTPKDMKFLAVSYYYELMHSDLFSNKNHFTPELLASKGVIICEEKNWQDLQTIYPKDENLFNRCFNLAYFDTLITKGYGFNKNKSFDTTNDVSWALGVVVFQASNNLQ